MQFHVIAALGNLTMPALAGIMGLQKQSATKIVNQLVEINFIQRFSNKTDRRIIKVDNTPEAKAYLKKFSIENMKHVSKYFESLSDKEFIELQQAIKSVNRILPHVSVNGKKSSSMQ